jgi:DNA processing protein
LYQDILKNGGLILSEYPLSLPPQKGTFLARNRIIAALSDGVLVTEAAEDSGSLVTAEWGFKLSKKVFAVPGPITSRMSDGSLKLLKQGAILVSCGEDIFKELKIIHNRKQNTWTFKNLTKEEREIISILECEGMTIDEIAKKRNSKVQNFLCLFRNWSFRDLSKIAGGYWKQLRKSFNVICNSCPRSCK